MNGPSQSAIEGTKALILHEQRTIEAYLGRETVPYPPATRVWMVGPHPDDNVLGPGGTALKYVAAGIPVQWVCLTDGRSCVADPSERERMARLRPQEERRCAELLGIGEPDLLNLPEDELTLEKHRETLVQFLVDSLERHRPDALFVPWFLETHPLHRFTNFLVAKALQRFEPDCLLFSWAAASFPPPRYVVDIEPVYARKKELMRAYESQAAFRDYVADCELLGHLQGSYGTPPLRYGEAFFAHEKQTYIDEMLTRGLEREDTLRCGAQPELPAKE